MTVALARTGFAYSYNSADDLLSLRRWLARSISPSTIGGGDPTGGDPYLFIEPLEGEFMRPAVTVELIDEGRDGAGAAVADTYYALLSVMITAYGNDRNHTLALASRVNTAIQDHGTDNGAYRPQMWAFSLDSIHPPRLARRMRVLQTSLSMGLTQTNDEMKWSRGLSLRILSPRMRTRLGGAVIQSVPGATTTVSAVSPPVTDPSLSGLEVPVG